MQLLTSSFNTSTSTSINFSGKNVQVSSATRNVLVITKTYDGRIQVYQQISQPSHQSQTFRRRLARRLYKDPVLTGLHHRNFLCWANSHRGWDRQKWHWVLFTIESEFSLSFAHGKVNRIYRRRVKDSLSVACRSTTDGVEEQLW